MSAFWSFLAFVPLALASVLLLWYAIRKNLNLSKQWKEEAEREAYARDARNILSGARRPTDDDVNAFLVHLVETKRLMDEVLEQTASDPIIEVTLRDLRDAIKQESTKLEQRGIR